MTATVAQLRRMDTREESIKWEKESWLRANDWVHESSLPGALWLWRKSFPESKVQWIWRGQEKIPHPPFEVNGATTEAALIIEAAWQEIWS